MEWASARASYYSGYDYAMAELETGTYTGEAIAIAIAVANVVVLCALCRAAAVCVKRGYCYRMCSPSTVSERAGLRDTDTEMTGGGDDDGASGRRADDDIIE